MIPVSRASGRLAWKSAPQTCMRTSELAFPPSTGRFCTRAVRAPRRAAARAAQSPERPPPTTTRP